MSIFVKWTVNPWSPPHRNEYCRETKNYYMHARGRGRDAKDSLYIRYFDTEAEALEYIRQREENKLEQKRVDRINSAGVELLEALESLMARLDPYDYPDEQGAGRAAIAKARGEA
mgnify:CR=1 FL=1